MSCCDASHSSSSSSVMPSISAEIVSRIDRIMATASNFFSPLLRGAPRRLVRRDGLQNAVVSLDAVAICITAEISSPPPASAAAVGVSMVNIVASVSQEVVVD